MRLPLIDPDKLTSEQRPFYDDMQAEIAKNFQGFKSSGAKGASNSGTEAGSNFIACPGA